MAARDFVLVDTETDNLIEPHLPEGRRVWEIAVLTLPADGTPPRTAVLQITDVDLTHADEQSLMIGRFAERFRHGGYGLLREYDRPWSPRPVAHWGCDEAEALATLADLIAPGAIIAGSNPGFDMANMAEMFRRHGKTPPDWYHHPRDIPNVATGWLLGRTTAGGDTGDLPPAAWACDWSEPSYSTRVISEACGVPEPADRHSAWADVLWMANLDITIGGPSGRLKQAAAAMLPG